jgi:hypothetical protein
MKNKILAIILLYLSFVLTCNATVYNNKISAKELSKILPTLNDIDCKFKQEKVLKNINKPLISGGNFSFKKQEGIFFETTYPIKSTTSYTNKDCEQINEIIMAISNKKSTKLDSKFNFYYEKLENIWTLGLRPKEKTNIDKYIDSITIKGLDNIQEIVILMKDGSKTTQWFSVE